ncbi:ABC-type transport system involved in multi-copper enzyme maturation permease subunit [Marmoricola sp. OAE513]
MAVSLATVPRRSVLYAAKVAAGALVAGVASLLAAVVSFLIVLGVTPDGHRTGNPSALLGIVLATVAVSAVGVAVGVLTRSSTAAIAVVAAAILLPKTAAGLLGDLQEWVVGASPGTVVTQFVSGAQLAADQRFPGGAAAAASAMLAVAALAVLVAAAAFHRRDG